MPIWLFLSDFFFLPLTNKMNVCNSLRIFYNHIQNPHSKSPSAYLTSICLAAVEATSTYITLFNECRLTGAWRINSFLVLSWSRFSLFRLQLSKDLRSLILFHGIAYTWMALGNKLSEWKIGVIQVFWTGVTAEENRKLFIIFKANK